MSEFNQRRRFKQGLEAAGFVLLRRELKRGALMVFKTPAPNSRELRSRTYV